MIFDIMTKALKPRESVVLIAVIELTTKVKNDD